MAIKSQKLISGLIESILSRKAAYPAKTGVSRMRSHSLLWAIGSVKIQSGTTGTESFSDPVFAKLPSEQELQFNAPAGNHSITIFLPGNIRIEVGADCPARLMTALLQALKNYA